MIGLALWLNIPVVYKASGPVIFYMMNRMLILVKTYNLFEKFTYII